MSYDVGRFYGYPLCCSQYFVRYILTSWPNRRPVSSTQRQASQGSGFIPCPECSLKIASGQTTLHGLIQDRECPLPFLTREERNLSLRINYE